MRTGLIIAMACCTLPFLLCAIHHGAVILFGCMKRAAAAASHRPLKRIAVLIPARNEARVIGDIVASLGKQDYPKELYDIIVLANNCTDGTAELAAAAGARVLVPDVPIRQKGDVLKYAFSALKDAGYDLYCIFDADNLVDVHYLPAVNNAFCAGAQAAQGVRDSKNPFTSIVSGWCSIFYWFMSRLYNETRASLGRSCAINGTGFAVSAALVEKIKFDPRSLTEDLEFSALCALHGEKVRYMPDAITYDEQPLTLWACYTQLRRWAGGATQCQKLLGGRLCRKKSFSSSDMLMVFSNGTLTLLGLIGGACGFALTASSLLAGQATLEGAATVSCLGMFLSLLVLQAAAVAVCRAMGKPLRPMLPAVITFPGYILLSFWVNVVTQFKGPPTKWVPIVHGGR